MIEREDKNTPALRAARILRSEVEALEARIAGLRFVLRAIEQPEYDDRYPDGKATHDEAHSR